MEMPQPGEPHRAMQRMVGDWSGEETVHPSPWDPDGGTATGRVRNRMAVDGFMVIQDYEHEREGAAAFHGHGVFRWDEGAGEYVLDWFDGGGGRQEFRGAFRGDVLEMRHEGPEGLLRARWDYSEEDAVDYRMEVSGDGESWAPFMEATYRREG